MSPDERVEIFDNKRGVAEMGAMSIGATLRAERLRKGQPLTAVAAETKICPQILNLLENDQFDRIPGGSYRRSFLRQYARVLGLDEDEVIASFQQQYEEPPLPLPTPPKTRPLRFLPGLAFLLLAAAGFVGLYTIADNTHPHWKDTAVRPVRPPADRDARGKPSTTVNSADTPAATARATPEGAGAPAPSVSSADRSTAAVRVAVTVLEPVWVSVKCDGNPSYTGTLAPAESRTFDATGVVTVLIGNAGGVTITVNGRPVGPIGARGEIQLLELTPSGVRRLPRRLGPPKETSYPPET